MIKVVDYILRLRKSYQKVLFTFAFLVFCSLSMLLITRINLMSQAAALLIILFVFFTFGRLLQRSNQQELLAKKEANRALSLLENAEQIAGMASWEWNCVTRTSKHSRNHFLLFGYEPGHLDQGMENFLPLIDEEDRNLLLREQEQSRAGGLLSCTTHFWATRKDGVRRYFKCTSYFSKNDKGEDIITGTSQDITEEYLLRKESQQRAYILEQVAEHNLDLIGVLDTEMRVLLWNKAYEESFGIPREQILGKRLTDVFPYLENDDKLILTKAALAGKKTIRKQLRFLKDQRIGEISFIPLKDANGKIEGVLTIIHDITELKQTTQLLEESNIRFEQAEEAGYFGSYRRNANTGAITVSENLYRLFGFEPGSEPPTIDQFFAMLHPDDKLQVMEVVQSNTDKDVIVPVRCRIIRKDGAVRHLKSSAIPVVNEKGEKVIYGCIADITEEELLKQQLQQRNHLMESVIDNTVNLVSAMDTEMRYTIWNKTHEKVLGLRKEDVLGKTFLEIFPEMAEHSNYHLIQSGLKGTPSYKVEATDKIRGIVAEFSHIPLKDKEGKVTGLLCVVHDITERKKAALKLEKANSELQLRNKALQEAYTFNKHIADLAPNGIYVFNLVTGTPVFMNKIVAEVLGYSQEELLHKPSGFLAEVMHPEDMPLLMEQFIRLQKAQDDDVFEFEYRIYNRAGEVRYQIAREAIFKRNERGEVEQIIGVAIDVTELKNAEKELKEKNKQLQQSNEELTSFSYVASHDLQEPLRKIQTFANFLEATESTLSEQGKSSLKRMQSAAARMRNLIQDLLAFSRIEMDKEVLETVDLSGVLKRARSSLRSAIEEKGATIVATDLPIVQGVSFKLQQLLENLVGNAIKYCDPGTAPLVQITCRQVVLDKDNAVGLQGGIAFHHLCIQDNGIGFEPQYAEKIFELFQRLHTQNEYPGTGLGLAICKKIVQAHGGHIQASSTPGEGSLFEIFLPVAEVAQEA